MDSRCHGRYSITRVGLREVEGEWGAMIRVQVIHEYLDGCSIRKKRRKFQEDLLLYAHKKNNILFFSDNVLFKYKTLFQIPTEAEGRGRSIKGLDLLSLRFHDSRRPVIS